jgi:mono/diheme cytochrome c family protein
LSPTLAEPRVTQPTLTSAPSRPHRWQSEAARRPSGARRPSASWTVPPRGAPSPALVTLIAPPASCRRRRKYPVTASRPGSPRRSGATTTTGGAANGEAIFTSNCGSCHVLGAAGTSGSIGPTLDELKPDASTVEEQVRNGGGGMPAFEGRLTDEEIAAVSQYVAANAGKVSSGGGGQGLKGLDDTGAVPSARPRQALPRGPRRSARRALRRPTHRAAGTPCA